MKKTIAVSRHGSATDFDTSGALRHFGLDPAKDVSVLPSAAWAHRLNGMRNGAMRFGAV